MLQSKAGYIDARPHFRPRNRCNARSKPEKLKTSECSALHSRRGRAQAEQFGSVTRRFPRSVIAIEAFSPMVFIHTRRIIMVRDHQHPLGLLAPPLAFSVRLWPAVWQAIRVILFRKRQVARF